MFEEFGFEMENAFKQKKKRMTIFFQSIKWL